jgi:hypothetical protein
MNSLIRSFLIVAITSIMILTASLSSCSGLPIKTKPDYEGVDPRTQKLVDEYLWLSTQYHIKFYNKVTIGFRNINEGKVVGFCSNGGFFREIDLDINYWNNSTNTTRTALLFHELAHCYCGRDHDYGKDLKYPETEALRRERALQWLIEGGPRPGYWDDGCPVSLMYPMVVDNECMRTHYREYTEEMFDRCKPW